MIIDLIISLLLAVVCGFATNSFLSVFIVLLSFCLGLSSGFAFHQIFDD